MSIETGFKLDWDTARKIARDVAVIGLLIFIVSSPEKVKTFAQRAGIDQIGSNGVHFRELKQETAALADKTADVQTAIQAATSQFAKLPPELAARPEIRNLAGVIDGIKSEADVVTASLQNRLAEQDQQLRQQGDAPSSDGWIYIGEVATEGSAEWERQTPPNIQVKTPRELTTQTYKVVRNVYIRKDVGPPDKEHLVGWRARQPIKSALQPGTIVRVERVEYLPAADGKVAVWALVDVART